MKSFDTDFVHISILDDRTVLVEAIEGVEIDLEKAKYIQELLDDEMYGEYGVIINRKADYSIVPHEVYGVINKSKKVKAIAIVLYKNNFLPLSSEQKFFKNKLEAFETIQDAHRWLLDILEQ